ncbi:hypothetical protein AKJ09_10819 [Labilithrix luteola]|uniref:Lipoprotein n=1 Tax=Labilithrix luteola TaxID=1391654 RepID=A0A0K1QEG1_9BACT|nr:hypothetical protein [Labilithrix luteola]AKV04156.1 hypothetical protein AKJ09_10819 [Labilithrix luteola]
MISTRSLRVRRCASVLGLGLVLVGGLCGTTACSDDASLEATSDEDLTSITARSRTLEFMGAVYVDASSSDDAIRSAVRSQAQSAFGPLRTTNIAVNTRELNQVDTSTFVKRTVKVIDTSVAGDAGKDMIEVRYKYKDNAVVDAKYAKRTAVPLALLNPNYRSQNDRVLRECTRNDSEARDFASSIWYVFEPTVASCQQVMRQEQQTIDADRVKLTDATKQVTKSEVDRLYLPIQVKLGADKTNKGTSYPDYQRLYRGGVDPNKLVISLVYGLIDHDHSAGVARDFNFGELMTNLDEVISAQDGFEIVPGPNDANLAHFTLASGKSLDNPSIKDLVGLHRRTDSLNLSEPDTADLEKQFAERIYGKWFSIERNVKVAVGSETPRDFAVKLIVFFGADQDSTPHKYATKNSDVFLYNGHSYIGFGPLDPRNFRSTDFTKGYQLFWIDGCVSYNYYEKDYIPLKEGGTKNLDLVTNGIEAPSWQSGHAMGQFLVTLLNGANASYRDLLEAAEATDPLRVVDGELDNEFTPQRFPITIIGR